MTYHRITSSILAGCCDFHLSPQLTIELLALDYLTGRSHYMQLFHDYLLVFSGQRLPRRSWRSHKIYLVRALMKSGMLQVLEQLVVDDVGKGYVKYSVDI